MPFDVALSDLTDMQRAFVEAYVENGGNGTDAAVTAGYTAEWARATAYKMLQLPHVQHAVQQRQRRDYTSLLNLGMKRLREALQDPMTKPAVILDAVIKLGDRVGLGPKPDADSKGDSKPISELSLAELQALAQRIAADMKVVELTPGAPVTVPV